MLAAMVCRALTALAWNALQVPEAVAVAAEALSIPVPDWHDVALVVPWPSECGDRFLTIRADCVEAIVDRERVSLLSVAWRCGDRAEDGMPAMADDRLMAEARRWLLRLHPRFGPNEELRAVPLPGKQSSRLYRWDEIRDGQWTGANAVLELDEASGLPRRYLGYVPPTEPAAPELDLVQALDVLAAADSVVGDRLTEVTGALLIGAFPAADSEQPVWRIEYNVLDARGERQARLAFVDAVHGKRYLAGQ